MAHFLLFQKRNAYLELLCYHQPTWQVWGNVLPFGNVRTETIVYGNIDSIIAQLKESKVWLGRFHQNQISKVLQLVFEVRDFFSRSISKASKHLAKRQGPTRKSKNSIFMPLGNLELWLSNHHICNVKNTDEASIGASKTTNYTPKDITVNERERPHYYLPHHEINEYGGSNSANPFPYNLDNDERKVYTFVMKKYV